MSTPNGTVTTVPNGRASIGELHPPTRQRIRLTKVKIISFLLELCQWSSLAVPMFVTSERVARTVDRIQAGNTTGGAEEPGGGAPVLPYYWLLVAASIAYVATVTLLIYLPVKYCFMWKNRFLLERAKWLPAILMHLVLSVLPCMSLMLVGIKLQDDNNEVPAMFDTYTEVPVPLIVLSVLVTSWVEKVRRFPIVVPTGAEMTEGPSSPRSMVNPVYTIDAGDDANQPTDEQTSDLPGTSTPSTPVSIRRSFPMSYSSLSRRSPARPKLTSNDDRARLLSIEFFAVYDIVELLLVTNFHNVCRTYWIFPIYVAAFLSMFKSILRLDHRFLPLVSMATHELPFLILRLALLGKFGIEVMSLVYPLKNLAAIAFYVYYNFILVVIKSRAFNKNRYSFPNRDDAISTTSFSTISSRPGSTLY